MSPARRRAHDGDAVGDGLLEGVELLAVLKDVRRVHGHALAFTPVVLEVGCGEDEIVEAHVRHGAAGAADVAGVEGSNEDDLDVVENGHGGHSTVRGPEDSRPNPCGVEGALRMDCRFSSRGLRTLAQSVP